MDSIRFGKLILDTQTACDNSRVALKMAELEQSDTTIALALLNLEQAGMDVYVRFKRQSDSVDFPCPSTSYQIQDKTGQPLAGSLATEYLHPFIMDDSGDAPNLLKSDDAMTTHAKNLYFHILGSGISALRKKLPQA